MSPTCVFEMNTSCLFERFVLSNDKLLFWNEGICLAQLILKPWKICAHILCNVWSISQLMIDSSSESVASAIKQMCGEAQPCCGELAKLWNLESIAYVAILFPFSLHLQKM